MGERGWGGGDPGVSLLSRASLMEVDLCAMPWIERSEEKASKAANGLLLRKRGT